MRTNENKERNGWRISKALYHRIHQTIQQNKMFFTNDARFPLTILTCVPWTFAWWVVWDVLRPRPIFLRTAYALLPWFCVQLDFYAYYTQKFALMQPLGIPLKWARVRPAWELYILLAVIPYQVQLGVSGWSASFWASSTIYAISDLTVNMSNLFGVLYPAVTSQLWSTLTASMKSTSSRNWRSGVPWISTTTPESMLVYISYHPLGIRKSKT